MSKSTNIAYASPSQAIEDSKKKTSLLKDNSWIKKAEEEDEPIDQDPNFGRQVLGRYKTTETVVSSSEPLQSTNTKTPTSVEALTKKFITSQDDLNSSTSPSKTSYTKTTYSSITSPKSTTTNSVTEKTTITTTTEKSSSKTDQFMDRVFSDKSKGSSYSPIKTTITNSSSSSTSNDAEDKLYDTLLPDSLRDITDSKTTVSKTETVVVKCSTDPAENKRYDTLIPSTMKDQSKVISTETVTIKSSNEIAEDQLYDTLIPKSISDLSTPTSSSITKINYTVDSNGGSSPSLSSTTRTSSYSSYTDDYPRTSTYTISTKKSDDMSKDTKSSPYTKKDSSYEFTSITSPSSYTSTTYKTTRSDDIMGDTYSRSSVKNIYASPERTVLEKDLCSYCRKPFIGNAKIILEDMKLNCHATCFKCEVCSSTLGHLKAGDSMWIYKQMVHCERCFEVTRDKWRR